MVVALVLQELLEPFRHQEQQVLLVMVPELQPRGQLIIPWLILKFSQPL